MEEIPEEAPMAQQQRSKALIQKVVKCPECCSSDVGRDYTKGEMVCNKCGLIVEDNLIDSGPEWRAFDSDQRDKRARTGAPVKFTKPNKGLATEIDQYNRDIRGVKISAQQRSQMYRLRKWHKRTSISSSMERNLAIALSELDRISSYLGLPQNIREAAALLYRKAVEKGLIRGRLIESVVAAVIYTICRQYNIPRTLDEISAVSGINKKEIGRTYRFLKRDLGIKMPLTDPTHYIPRFASELGLTGPVQEKARTLLNIAIKRGLISGRGPTGVAAAAVYIAGVLMGERRTQKEVADVAGVTEVTIRNRYRELKDRLGLDVPA
jgi:transcription initiation factor TFIIB